MLEEVDPSVQFATLGLFHQRPELGAVPADDETDRPVVLACETDHVEDQVNALSRHKPGQRHGDRLVWADAERAPQISRILLSSLEIDRIGCHRHADGRTRTHTNRTI